MSEVLRNMINVLSAMNIIPVFTNNGLQSDIGTLKFGVKVKNIQAIL